MSHTLERKVLHDVSKRIGFIDVEFKGAKSDTAEKIKPGKVGRLFLNILKMKCDRRNNYFQNTFLIAYSIGAAAMQL